MSAINSQIDGSHYTEMYLQPLELTYMIGATPAFCKLAKYGSRNKGDKLINLNKALHCIKYEQEMQSRYANIMAEAYPFGFDLSKSELASKLIEIFTPNPELRSALKAMYNGEYERAIRYIEVMIESETE